MSVKFSKERNRISEAMGQTRPPAGSLFDLCAIMSSHSFRAAFHMRTSVEMQNKSVTVNAVWAPCISIEAMQCVHASWECDIIQFLPIGFSCESLKPKKLHYQRHDPISTGEARTAGLTYNNCKARRYHLRRHTSYNISKQARDL